MKFIGGKEILDYYKKKGITLWSDHGKLKYKAPKVSLSEENLELLKKYKEMIIDYLESKKEDITVVVDKKSKFKAFPMTDVQSAYLLGRKDTFEYGGVACHVYLEIKYDQLDVEKVKEVWQVLINRHDMLRAVMDQDGYQRILEEVPELEVPYFEMSRDDVKKTEEFQIFREEMSHKVYELGKWPMFGIAVSKDNEGATLHFSMEFLIADWMSIWMLLSEFELLYFNSKRELSEFEISFRDYLLAERNLKESDSYERDKAYWLKEIKDLPLAPQLPRKRREISNDKPTFKRKMLQMSPKAWMAFKDNAQKYGITPTVAVLTVYADVIERWSQNKRFSINLTVLNRMPLHQDINKVVGDFTSVSLLDVDESKEEEFVERAKRINANLFEKLDHRLYSGIEVIRELARKRGREAALMPIVFTSAIGLIGSNNRLIGKFEGEGITQTPQVFIDCQAMDGNFGLQINWDVREGIFPDGMIDDMFQIFEMRLNHLSESLDTWHKSTVLNLPHWQKYERDKVNNTEVTIAKELLHSKFLKQVKLRPNQIAVDDGQGDFTYEELNNQAKAIAAEIVKLGGKPGDKIAIIMEKSRYQLAAVLAVLYMGGVYVPIDVEQAKLRRDNILENIDANIVLSSSKNESSYKEGIVTINVDKLSFVADEFSIIENDSGNPAYIIYTSGSTGEPKGVVISHQAAVNTIEDINQKFQLKAEDRVLGLSQLNFDLSVFDIFGILSVGGTIIYPEVDHYMDPAYWSELIVKHNITIWNTVPTLMKILLTHLQTKGENSLSSLRLALLSGDWIPLEMPKQITEQISDIKVISLGGATEASIWSIYHQYEGVEEDWVSIPYGKPLANQSFYILDDKLNECPVWSVGHIYIAGEGLALEYYGDVELTNKKFLHHPVNGERIYHTGDMGRYLPSGEIEFLGREDNQVKIRGRRIELGEIEYALNTHPSVGASVVFASLNKNEICAVIEPAKLEEYSIKESNLEFKELTSDLKKAANQSIEKLKAVDIQQAMKAREEAALTSMLFSLQKLGLLKDDKYYDLDEFLYCDKIKEKYRWLMMPWLSSLEQGGFVKKKEGRLYKAKFLIIEDYQSEIWDKAYSAWSDELGSSKFIDYIKLNAINLVEILEGNLDPIGLLYLDDDTDFSKALYVDNTMAKYLNESMGEFVSRVARKDPNRKLRILEIGAGTGATTEHILNRLEGFNYEYYFTDQSKYFFADASTRFGDKKEVTIKELDIDRDCVEQGFLPNSFDIIIGAYVLENAKDIEKSIDYLEALLMPQGHLLFSAPIRDEAWLLASQALMMSNSQDSLREGVVFIEQDKWLEVLDRYGDNSISKVIPEKDSILSSLGLNLFIKQFKREQKIVAIEDINKHLSLYLPDYMIPERVQIIDRLPLNSNNKIDREGVAKWMKELITLDSPSEDDEDFNNELEIKLAEVWREVLEIDSIGKNQNFYDFGADSLIMAQATTKIRNQIKIDIPFETMLRQMLNHPTIKELAEFILEQKEEDHNEDSKKQESKNKLLASNDFAYIQDYGGDIKQGIRVIIHGGLGSVDSFRHLGPELVAKDRGKVIALGIADVEKYCSLDSKKVIQFLADRYTELLMKMEVRRIHLIGYSFSGVIAVEMAKRLVEQGIEVEDLAIIDGGSMPVEIDEELMYELLFIGNLYISLSDLGFKSKQKLERIFEKLIDEDKRVLSINDFESAQDNSNLILDDLKKRTQEERFEIYQNLSERNTGNKVPIDKIVKLYKIFVQSFKALHFIPEAYFGDIRYFSSKEKEGIFKYFELLLKDWDDVCLGEFSIKEIEGNHYSCVESRQNVKKLVDLLDRVDENNVMVQ